MKTNGIHVLVEYVDGSPELLSSKSYVESAMVSAAQSINATIVGTLFHQFSPDGISGVVVIAESHFSIHTWPQDGYASVDFYTCGGLDPKPAIDMLAWYFCAKPHKIHEILRGHPKDM